MESEQQRASWFTRTVAILKAFWQAVRQRIAYSIARMPRWQRVLAYLLVFLIVFSTLFATTFGIAQAKGASAVYTGHPNTYHPTSTSIHATNLPHPKPVISGTPHPASATLHHPFTPSMQPLILPLLALTAAQAISSDGVLDITVPAGAVTSQDLVAHGGGMRLAVYEVAPPSGSIDSANSSGVISYGTYLFQLQDAQGHELTNYTGLHQDITLTYHWLAASAPVPFSIIPMVFTEGASLPFALPVPAHHLATTRQSFTLPYNSATHTFTGHMPIPQSGSGGGFSSTVPVGYFGKPDAFQNDLHTGGLTDSIGISVPSGPGGLTPSLSLAYSSNAVAATHGPQSAAGWVGEGWSLDPGQISWSEEEDLLLGGWRSTWSIDDPLGESGTLIPPTTNVETYYNDTPNSSPSTTPVTWHTANESFARIVSYTNPTANSYFPSSTYPVQPPCFRVWLTNGDMEEFGCTPDSLQWYPGNSGKNYVTAWKLDLITDPSGNQIHFTYIQDMQTKGSNTFPQDIYLSTVAWDSPGCHNANTACTGSSWAPLMKVNFTASHAVSHTAPGATICTQSGSLRCDDPSGSSAPLLLSAYVLNDVEVQVRTSGTGSWSTLSDYQLAYAQATASPSTIVSPFGGATISLAGDLLLEQVKTIGDDGSTSDPAQTFGYSTDSGSTDNYTEYYEDSILNPASGAGCGPVWNTGNGNGCILWSKSYQGSSWYMTSSKNGMGLYQTFSWVNDRTNQHGVDAGNNALDPGYCTRKQLSEGASTTYPCNESDDNGWSHVTLATRTTEVLDPTTSHPTQSQTGTWTYDYDLASLTAQECSDCKVGMYWGDTNNADPNDFYDGIFTGFAFGEVINADGSLENDWYYSTEGWGVWGSSVTCLDAFQTTCPVDPYWDLTNAASGGAYQVDRFNPEQGSTWPLEQRTLTTYADVCPTPTLSPSQSGKWNNNVVSELDQDNPTVVCDVRTASTATYLADGLTSYPASGAVSNVPEVQVGNNYDDTNTYGHLTQATTTGNDLGGTPTIVKNTAFIWHDAVTTTSTSASGTYIVSTPAFQDVEDGSSHQQQCGYTLYDGATSYASGSQSSLTTGLATQHDTYATCPSSWTTTNVIATKTGYNSNGDQLNAIDADATAGISGHTATTGSCTGYTSCATYDGTYGVLPASATNAFNQSSTIAYTTTQAFGFGLWPTSTTDANGQTTSTTYDALGRTITTVAPGDSSGSPTTSMAYSFSACTASPSQPCVEVDTTQRLTSTTTVKKEDFYDGYGNHAESVTPGFNGQDVVQYAMYDVLGRMVFQSQPYFVTAAAGYFVPDDTQPGTSSTYDGLGRTLTAKDPKSATTTMSYAAACNVSGTSDTACYAVTTTIDADSHQSTSLADALGQTVYAQSFTGTSSYTLYRTTKQQYDYLGDVTAVTYADGTHQATATYNALKEQTASSDPDLGSVTSSYDPNGNMTQATLPGGTVYSCYDGLNRVTGKSFSSSTCASPFASSTYDSTTGGNDGVGRLTGETFASGPSQGITGSYAYTYDARGRQTGWSMTIGGTSYPFSLGYNDAGQPTSLTYPDGDVLTTSYDANGWYSGSSSSTSGTLIAGVGYGTLSGASHLIGQAALGNGIVLTNSYDNDLHLTEANYQKNVHQILVTQYSDTRGYDAVGNVVTDNTSVLVGSSVKTDNQAFCYDEQNRLTWAGSTGTPPCQSLTAGTLTAANYTQSYAFDTINRLTTGPDGTPTYGTSSHLDAVTSTSAGYSAAYDAGGAMTCRAPTSSQTCTGTPTGQALTYDAEERLLTWQNAQSSPTTAAAYGYDGAGHRVEQQVTTSGTTTTTYYLGSYEEVSVTGSTTTTTKYYATPVCTALTVNGTLSYVLGNGLHSVTVAMSSSGSITATQMYTPYGSSRYSTGTMPTSKGFTGQRLDPSGLSYFNARYYDATVGVFISADVAQGPNRYAYVGGNPETLTDPTGQRCGIPGPIPDAAGSGGLCGPPAPTPPPPPPGNCRHVGCHEKDTTTVSFHQGGPEQALTDYILEQLARHGVPGFLLGAVVHFIESLLDPGQPCPGCDHGTSVEGCTGLDGAACGLNGWMCPVTASSCSSQSNYMYGNIFNYTTLGNEETALGNVIPRLFWFSIGGGVASIAAFVTTIWGGLASIIAGGILTAITITLIALTVTYNNWQAAFKTELHNFLKDQNTLFFVTWQYGGATFWHRGSEFHENDICRIEYGNNFHENGDYVGCQQ